VDVQWFPSKVDWWLGAILAAAPLTQVAVLAWSLSAGSTEDIVASAIGCAVVGAIWLLLIVPTRYGISHDELIVRFGVVRQRIPLADIVEVAPTRSLLSAPALSLDRLAIRAGPKRSLVTMISPAERDAFLATLASMAGLVPEGDRLVRR
jgi:membrane protein YdbS with pleckstrin-like domain